MEAANIAIAHPCSQRLRRYLLAHAAQNVVQGLVAPMMGVSAEVDFIEMESFIAFIVSDKKDVRLHQEVKGDYLESTLTSAQGTDADRPGARIRSSGVELFFLVVDEGYIYREFESEDDEQKDVLRLMVELAVRYLDGRYSRQVERSFFGRQKETLTIEYGQLYYLDKLPRRSWR